MNKRKETEQKEFIDKSIEKINYKKTQAKIDDDLNRCCFKNCICSLALQLWVVSWKNILFILLTSQIKIVYTLNKKWDNNNNTK